MKIWILLWRHSDNSVGGVVRSYSDQATARLDQAMLVEHCYDKLFELVESTLQGVIVPGTPAK